MKHLKAVIDKKRADYAPCLIALDEASGNVSVVNSISTSKDEWRKFSSPAPKSKLNWYGDWSWDFLVYWFIGCAVFLTSIIPADIMQRNMEASTGLVMLGMAAFAGLAVIAVELGFTYFQHFADMFGEKSVAHPMYNLFIKRPHSVGVEPEYRSYMVRVDTVNHKYELLEVRRTSDKYENRVLLRVKAPKDVLQAAELGVEMAQAASALEEKSQKSYVQVVKQQEIDDSLQAEQETLRNLEEQTLAQVMTSAVGYSK